MELRLTAQVVLSDLTMPRMNGIEAARQMREIEAEDPPRRRSTIVIISAAAESATCPPEIDSWKVRSVSRGRRCVAAALGCGAEPLPRPRLTLRQVKGSFRLASIRDLLTQQQNALDQYLASR